MRLPGKAWLELRQPRLSKGVRRCSRRRSSNRVASGVTCIGMPSRPSTRSFSAAWHAASRRKRKRAPAPPRQPRRASGGLAAVPRYLWPRCQPCFGRIRGEAAKLVAGMARSASFFVAKAAFGPPPLCSTFSDHRACAAHARSRTPNFARADAAPTRRALSGAACRGAEWRRRNHLDWRAYDDGRFAARGSGGTCRASSPSRRGERAWGRTGRSARADAGTNSVLGLRRRRQVRHVRSLHGGLHFRFWRAPRQSDYYYSSYYYTSAKLAVSNQYLYVYLGTYGQYFVRAYPLGSTSISYQIPFAPNGMVTDSHDNLYLSTGSMVLVYAPGATLPTRVLAAGLPSPGAMVVDGHDQLYVSNGSERGFQAGSHSAVRDHYRRYRWR